jgi:glycosyltransferase involved in cell wall biosynthesis
VRYPERTKDLENFLKTLPTFRPVEIYDRNFGKDDPNYQFPPEYRSYIVGTLPFDKIDLAYKGYQYAINLNSIKQSQTMFARRVFELLGSNTITISNYSRGLRLMLGDLVITSDDGGQILHSLRALADDPDRAGKLKIAGLRKMMLEHTYGQRFTYIRAKVSGMKMPEDDLPVISVLAQANSQAEVDRLTAQFLAQNHRRKRLLLLAVSNVQLNATGNICHLSSEHVSGKKIGDVADDATWIACMSSQDYYGPNYLLDIAIATRYTKATLIGKAAYFQAHGQKSIQLMQAQNAYKPAGGFPVRCSAVRTYLVANENLPQWLDEISDRRLESDQAFAIDSYNYCLNASPDLIAAIKDRVNDLPGLDMGLNIHQLQKMAEQIPPATTIKNENVLGPDWLAVLFGKCRPKKIKVTITDKTLVLNSHLKDGQHEYLYADEDVPAEVIAKNNALKCFLDTTPGLAVSLVALFLDAYNQRISHVIFQANHNATADIPTEAAYIRFGLRIYAGGESEIKGLVIGHRDMQPSAVLGKAKYLLLTNHYPSYDDLYRNGFVHSRVRAYKKIGVNVEVFRLRKGEPISWHEFQNVDVITGSQEALYTLLASGRYQNVLVHFLSAEMWEVLRKFADRIRMTVWLHGAEIHAWYRRKFNFEREDQIEKAKLQSEKRLKFWREILNPISKNFQLVFVSNSLSREVMEDLGFELPKSHYQIIHNPINTDLFQYRKKDPQQRRKIISIRPYASNQYANDLSVETILYLSKEPFFNELEFRLVGDGKLFEKTLAPLKGMENVIIEQCFLTQQKIAQLHKEYGLFLCPTRWDSQGVSRDEAMASGLVPITNAVAAIPEFVDSSCGILAPAEDARALAEGIMTLYENPGLFETMSVEAAQNVRRNRDLDKVIERERALFVSTGSKKMHTKS